MQSTWELKAPFGSLFKLLITLFLVVSIPVVTLTVWVNWALAPASVKKQEQTFVIKKGESVASIATRLKKENLLRNALMFRIYLKMTGLDEKIQSGSFKLSTDQPVKNIALTLTRGRLDKWLTFVEGLRKEEVAEIAAKNFDINKDKFLAKAPEGELFPDTYLIPINASEEQILAIFQNNFGKKYNSDHQKIASEKGLTKQDVITIASIVERETKSKEERPIIAGILLKRWKEGIPLATDATIQYALGFSDQEETWWRKNLTEDDLKIDSPYNTRSRTGLPPGPICSPGLASIDAVLTPKESPYYFYLHDKKGQIHYAATFEEHQQNIARFLSP
ncbi:MAG: endolytic transglycosylase MltG [bacterium]|nr:endolytic transglycosylase MltG [bacterium]